MATHTVQPIGELVKKIEKSLESDEEVILKEKIVQDVHVPNVLEKVFLELVVDVENGFVPAKFPKELEGCVVGLFCNNKHGMPPNSEILDLAARDNNCVACFDLYF